jgi:hypothetical protein
MNKFWLILAPLIIDFSNNNYLFSQKNIELSVNKNIELLFAAQIQSKMDSFIIPKGYAAFPLTTQLDFQLKSNYQNAFLKFKSCSQIEYFNELITKGFIFSLPFNTVLMTDSSLQIKNECWLQNLPYPQTTKDSILLFIEKLKEFRSCLNFIF